MKIVNVVAAIICDDYKRKTKIFATQRGYGDFKDGWEFPGGKIEEGETPEEVLDLRFEDAGFEILFNATGNDNRAGREAEMWVNAIARKNGIY